MALITSGISILETRSKLLSGIYLFGTGFERTFERRGFERTGFGRRGRAAVDFQTEDRTGPETQGSDAADRFDAQGGRFGRCRLPGGGTERFGRREFDDRVRGGLGGVRFGFPGAEGGQ